MTKINKKKKTPTVSQVQNCIFQKDIEGNVFSVYYLYIEIYENLFFLNKAKPSGIFQNV